MQTVEIELEGNERMLLDALMKLKASRPDRCRSAAPAAKACAARTR